MSEATDWTRLLFEKQQQQAAADRAAQTLRQTQLNQAFDASDKLAAAMKKYREDGIAAKLKEEAALAATTPEARAKASMKAGVREQARRATSPGMGSWFSPPLSSYPSQTMRPVPKSETYDASQGMPEATAPAVDTLGRAPTSLAPTAPIYRNQQIPAEAVNHLRANPGTAADFNQKYGSGTAEAYLQ